MSLNRSHFQWGKIDHWWGDCITPLQRSYRTIGLTTEYRATFPTILIEVAHCLVSRFKGILFKWLVGSLVSSKVYYSNGSLACQSIPRYIIQMAQWLVGSPVDSLVSLAKFLRLFWSCMWALVTHIKTYRKAFAFYKYTFLRRIRWFDKFSAVAIKEENTLYNSPVVSHLLS